jgi:hypothetical protein
VTIAFRALKLIGLDVPAQIHSAKAALELRVEEARSEIREAARHAVIVAAFAAAAVLAAMGLVAIGLAALYTRVAESYGVYAGLGAVAGVLLAVIVVCIAVAELRSRAPAKADTGTPEAPPVQPRTAPRKEADAHNAERAHNPGASSQAFTESTDDLVPEMLSLGSALLSEYLASPAAHPALSAGLRHMRAAAKDPAGDPLDLATDVVRDGDRTSMLAVLAAAAALGWIASRALLDRRR